MPADPGMPFEFPDVAAIALLDDIDIEPIAGKHRAPKASVVDAHEIDKLALRFRTEGVDNEDCRGLCHRLDDQHPRHHRPGRKMSLKVIFADRYILDAGG